MLCAGSLAHLRARLCAVTQARARGIKDDPSKKDTGTKSDGDAKETPYDVGSLAHLPPAAGLQSILAVNRLRGFKLGKGDKAPAAGPGGAAGEGGDEDGAAVSLTYSQVRVRGTWSAQPAKECVQRAASVCSGQHTCGSVLLGESRRCLVQCCAVNASYATRTCA